MFCRFSNFKLFSRFQQKTGSPKNPISRPHDMPASPRWWYSNGVVIPSRQGIMMCQCRGLPRPLADARPFLGDPQKTNKICKSLKIQLKESFLENEAMEKYCWKNTQQEFKLLKVEKMSSHFTPDKTSSLPSRIQV
jgi:hypothetical protein